MQKTGDIQALPGPAQESCSALEWSTPYERKDHSATSILVLACLWLVFLIYPVVGLLREAPRLAPLALGMTSALAFFGLYLWTIWHLAFGKMAKLPWRAFSLMAALALTLPLLLGATWQGFFIYIGLLAGFIMRLRHLVAAMIVMVGLTILIATITQAPWWETVALTTVTLLGSSMASGIRRLREINQDLRTAHHQIAALAANEERLRLARELHDSIKQQVFVTSMELGAARALLDQDRQGARTHLYEAESATRQLQQDLKALVCALRPAPLENQSLAQAIRAYSASWSQRTQIATTMRMQEERTTPHIIEQELLRVVQEALTNIEKHSAASQVVITLTWSDLHIRVQVADNGRGLVPEEARGRGYGLLHIRERVAALLGELHIESEPGSGTTLTCTCPLPSSGKGREDG